MGLSESIRVEFATCYSIVFIAFADIVDPKSSVKRTQLSSHCVMVSTFVR